MIDELKKSLKNCGVSPAVLRAVLRRAGPYGVRQVLNGTLRYVAKILHPDMLGGKVDATYKNVSSAIAVLAETSDEDLNTAIVEFDIKSAKQEDTIIRTTISIVSKMAEFCKVGHHVPGWKTITIYPPGGFENAKDSINPVTGVDRRRYVIVSTMTGIRYRRENEEVWHTEDGMFVMGCFNPSVVIVAMLRMAYSSFNLPLSQKISGGGGVAKATPLPARRLLPPGLNNRPEFENAYNPKIVERGGLALVSGSGAVYYFGHIWKVEE